MEGGRGRSPLLPVPAPVIRKPLQDCPMPTVYAIEGTRSEHRSFDVLEGGDVGWTCIGSVDRR